MNIEKAKETLYKNNISYTSEKKVIARRQDITKPVIAAINTLYKSNSSYYHPNHARNLNTFWGAKNPSIKKAYGSVRDIDISAMQEKAYQVYWDSAIAQSIINSLKVFTVNKGLRLQSTPSNKILGLPTEITQDFSAKAEALWNSWAHDKDSNYTRNLNYNEIEYLRACHFYVYGEYFYLRRFLDGRKICPLNIQLIHPLKIKTPLFSTVLKVRETGGDIINGIEVDKFGGKAAIYIETVKDNKTDYLRVPFLAGDGFPQIAHGFLPHTEIDQVQRGIPFLAFGMHELEKIADAELFELDSMAINSTIAGFIKQTLGSSPLLDPLSSMGDDFMSGEMSYAETTSGEVYVDKSINVLHKNIDKGGIMLQGLPPGTEIMSYDTKRPNLNIQSFIEGKMGYMASGMGHISLEIVKQTFGQNFSASRASTDLAWKSFSLFNSIFAIDNQIDYEILIEHFVRNNFLNAPKFNDNYIYKKAWSGSIWHGQQKPTFNPVQEASASEILVNNAFSTREAEAQKHSGSSAFENIERLKIENEALRPIEKTDKTQNIEERKIV